MGGGFGNGSRNVTLGMSGGKEQQRHDDDVPHSSFDQPRDPLGNRGLDKLQVTGLDRDTGKPFPYHLG